MSTFHLEATATETYVLFRLQGYIEQNAGDKIKERYEFYRQAGHTVFVLDFSSVELMSSPGLAAILEITSRLVEDDDGDLAAFGFDKQTHIVLEMSSFFYLAKEAKSLEDALIMLDLAHCHAGSEKVLRERS